MKLKSQNYLFGRNLFFKPINKKVFKTIIELNRQSERFEKYAIAYLKV
jgi:hypothetical protein